MKRKQQLESSKSSSSKKSKARKTGIDVKPTDVIIPFDEIQVVKKYSEMKLQSTIAQIQKKLRRLKGDAFTRYVHDQIEVHARAADAIPNDLRLEQQRSYTGPNIYPAYRYIYHSKAGVVQYVHKIGLPSYEDSVRIARDNCNALLLLYRTSIMNAANDAKDSLKTSRSQSGMISDNTDKTQKHTRLKVADINGASDIVKILVAAWKAGILTEQPTVQIITALFERDINTQSFGNSVSQLLRRRKESYNAGPQITSRSPKFDEFLVQCLSMLERSSLDSLRVAIDTELRKRNRKLTESKNLSHDDSQDLAQK